MQRPIHRLTRRPSLLAGVVLPRLHGFWRRGIFIFIWYVVFAQVLYAGKTKQEPDYREIAEETLKETWKTILEKHYNKNAKNAEWNKILLKHQPKILKSRNSRQLLASINLMIKELGTSHICLFPPIGSTEQKAIARQHLEKNSSGIISMSGKNKGGKVNGNKGSAYPADLGLRLCIADKKICVLGIRKNSSAENAGIKMGDEIISIYGVKFDSSKYTESSWDIIAEGMLTGKSNTVVPLKIRNGKGKERSLKVTRQKIPGSNWIKMGSMPKFSGKVEYKLLKGNIGCIFFSPCFPQQITAMHKIIRTDFKNIKGLILDIRNNPGGMMLMSPGIAGWVTDKKLDFGKMVTRETPLKLESYPQQSAFTGPLAILVNRGTCSAAEVFAAGMQDNKRAVLFGETTSGKCLPSICLNLSTGFRLQTVFGDYVRSNGKRIEKQGVKPDFAFSPKKEDLISGIDTACEAARKYLLGKK